MERRSEREQGAKPEVDVVSLTVRVLGYVTLVSYYQTHVRPRSVGHKPEIKRMMDT